MTTALEICKSAYAETNPGQDLTSFSQQDWPYSLALGYLNKVISEMNIYSYYFMETATLLPFTAGGNSYSLSDLDINPKSIVKVHSQSYDGVNTQITDVRAINYYDYTTYYPFSILKATPPTFYARYANTLYLNNAPQVDYQVYVYHLAKIPKMVSENDTFPVPFEFEHVFQDGIKCHLLMDLSRSDALQKYQIWQKKISDMAAEIEIDYAMGTQLPRNW